TRRQLILRHAGNITMGLLGVASVCKLDFNGFSEGATQLYDTTVSALEVGSKAVEGAQSIMESGQGLLTSIKGGILSGGRQVWYLALREAQEHVKNGRLADFNRIVFEAPCRRDVEFLWGICQLLGEVAVDPLWDVSIRQHALDFLAELYKNDTIRTPDEGSDACILHFLRQASAMPDTAISDHARLLLRGLDKHESVVKQNLYRDCLVQPLDPYPIKVLTVDPTPSTLLARVQAIPDVEYGLHRLKQQRLGDHREGVYIPPQAKPSLQAKDDTLFPLMEKVQEFFSSQRQVLLLLGDSGAGKSTFNLELEHTLWKGYKKYGPIPLHITLPTIDKPEQDLIGKRLRHLKFSEAQILEMKLYRQFIVICDGYDESQLRTNLHNTNQLNQPGQWKAKVVISCRSQYLSSDYRARFQPQAASRYDQTATDLFQEAVIAPFLRNQVEQYIEQYIKGLPVRDPLQDRPSWTKEEYMDKLLNIPNLMDLVSNPFLLTLSLEALPAVVDHKKDLATIRITRVQLYDSFVKRWIKVNQARLESSTLSDNERSTFDLLVEDDFVYHGIQFQKDLAMAIFKEHAGNPVVQIPGADLRGGLFDSADLKGADLSDANVGKVWLRRANLNNARMSGVQFGELPYLVLDEKVSMCLFSPDGKLLVVSTTEGDISIYDTTTWRRIATYLGGTVIAISPNGLELATGGDLDLTMYLRDLLTGKTCLYLRGHDDGVTGISYSPDGSKVASSSGDWTVRTWSTVSGDTLHVLSGHTMRVTGVAFSPSGLRLVSCSLDRTVRIWDAQTGESIVVVDADSDYILSVAYSHDGSQIASGHWKDRVRLWNAETGELRFTLADGGRCVRGVAFSPDDRQIASCSYDNTIHLWDPHTGKSCDVYSGHSDQVNYVAYSPTGDYIASSSWDGTVRLWKAGGASTGVPSGDSVHYIECLDISPCGNQIVTGNDDGSLRLWKTLTGKPTVVLEGHSKSILAVAFSLCGGQIASASGDSTVRLWDAQTGMALHVLEGHTSKVISVAFSPTGHQIASASADKTVRTWDKSTGEHGFILKGHTDWVRGVSYSPSGDRIASCSDDKTVRLWCPQTGEQQHVLMYDGHVAQVVYSPDGEYLVSRLNEFAADKIQCWDPESGQPARRFLDGLDIDVSCCSFSPIGNFIAAIGDDGRLRLWDVALDKWLDVRGSKIERSKEVRWMQGPDCMYLATIPDKSLRIWTLVESDNAYRLQLVWGTERNALNMEGASMNGVVGLSPVNLELMKQRGAIVELTDE
ncbi:hypothetical protein BGX29_001056, partial [Mortierella sp. GBA35]